MNNYHYLVANIIYLIPGPHTKGLKGHKHRRHQHVLILEMFMDSHPINVNTRYCVKFRNYEKL